MPLRGRTSATDETFAALANPTRRDALDLLLSGPLAVEEIAARFDMARPSVSEHLRVLREAGLVAQTRAGRQRLYAVTPEPLADLARWLTPYERFWRASLSNLATFLDSAPGDNHDATARTGGPSDLHLDVRASEARLDPRLPQSPEKPTGRPRGTT
jgi:DNA-binding transcriptional ArsR family regulator